MIKREAMETWRFIKEEPREDECFGVNDSYFTINSEQSCCVKLENAQGYCNSAANDEDTWNTEHSYHPKLRSPLQHLEYSHNQEIAKYPEPLLPAITSSRELLSTKNTTELIMNIKTESVELQTLCESTIMQTPSDAGRYAFPWDFVKFSNQCDQKSTIESTEIKLELDADHWNTETSGEECNRRAPSCKTDNEAESPMDIIKKPTMLYSCDICGKHFENKSSMRVHIKFLHVEMFDEDGIEPRPPEGRVLRSSRLSNSQYFHPLETLNQDLTKKANLSQHRINKQDPVFGKSKSQVKPDKDSFPCKICGKIFTQMSYLRRHCIIHDGRKPYECDVCKKTFVVKQYLRQHMLSHNPKIYPCDRCSRSYSRQATLKRHSKLHETEDLKKKSYTPKKVKETKNIPAKIKDNKKEAQPVEAPSKLYKCNVCGEDFDDKSSMAVHIEFLHVELFGQHASEPQPRSSMSYLKKPYKCRICSKRYTQSSHLQRHKKSHSPNKRNVCKVCQQDFSTTSSLSRHMLAKHNEPYSKIRKPRKSRKKVERTNEVYACKICNKTFRQFYDLRRHCVIHDGRKPYECDLCKKQFRLKSYLYAHILTHDNWKPYPCDSCTKFYRRKSSLQRHVQLTHSGWKKFECQICAKSYKHQASYRIHMERHHDL